MVAIGICYKNLTIFIARYKFYYLLHTSGIKLVEDIVEKKKRRRLLYSAAQKLKLRHFQRKNKCLILPLAAFMLHVITVK